MGVEMLRTGSYIDSLLIKTEKKNVEIQLFNLLS